MPTMAMQSLNLGGMTRPQTAAAYRSRCAVRTMAVVAAPPKTGLKTEISEKVSLFCGIALGKHESNAECCFHLWCAYDESGSFPPSVCCWQVPPEHAILGRRSDAAHPSDCVTLCLQIFKEAQTLLPGGVNSPVRAFKSVGGQPIIFDHVEGSHCYDVDGNKVTGLTRDILTLI